MRLLLIAAVFWFITDLTGWGNDFEGESFSLRLPATLSNFSAYADVAAKGGASAAGKFGSSVNPAANAWSFPASYDFGVSAQYSNVAFQEGTNIHFVSESIFVDAHQFGVIRFSFGNVWSNDAQVRTLPLDFTYSLDTGRLEWAKRWGAFSVGAAVSYAESETTFRTPKLIFSDTDRHTTLGRVGALWQPARRWLVGVVADIAYAPADTHSLTPTALGLVSGDARDINRQWVVRPGISYEWRDNALLQLDYQHGTFWNDTGSLDVDRFSIGGDFPLARFLFVRAGGLVSTRGDFGWTAGFGFYPRKGLTFDFAYQNDVFPELQRELGHSRTLNASVSWQF